MTQAPNRHVILFTGENPHTGVTYDDQLPQIIRGDLPTANRVMAERIEAIANAHFPQVANIRNLRLHSWYEASTGPWAPAPMSGAENDEA
jgi:hypothetical protein